MIHWPITMGDGSLCLKKHSSFVCFKTVFLPSSAIPCSTLSVLTCTIKNAISNRLSMAVAKSHGRKTMDLLIRWFKSKLCCHSNRDILFCLWLYPPDLQVFKKVAIMVQNLYLENIRSFKAWMGQGGLYGLHIIAEGWDFSFFFFNQKVIFHDKVWRGNFSPYKEWQTCFFISSSCKLGA